MKKAILIIFLTSLCSITCTWGQKYPAVEISGSQLRTIHSDIKNQTYTLHINLPGGYDDVTEDLPVMYLLDSQWDFQLMCSVYGEQYYDGYMPKVILVGVTWDKGDDPNVLRRRDFTPTLEENTKVGGEASTFLDFFEKELFPFIEKEYKADGNDRTLMGCSLGGLFTMYTLFNRPEMFKRYIAASPAIGWDHHVLFGDEERFSAKTLQEEKFVFMGHGSEEFNIVGFELFTQKIKSRNMKNLNLESRLLTGVGHSGTKAIGYTWGTQFVFSEPGISLDIMTLEKYAGVFVNESGGESKLVSKMGSLFFQKGRRDYPLTIVSPSSMRYDGAFLNISLELNDDGIPTMLTEHRYGSDTKYKRK